MTLTGCASRYGFLPEGEGLQRPPEMRLDVFPLSEPVASPDGFEVVVEFEVSSSGPMPFRHVVQEIRQTMTQVDLAGRTFTDSVSLVEAFRLSYARKSREWLVFGLEPFQRDRHFDSGYQSGMESLREVTVERRMFVYPALIEDADWTFYGFAHLPSSRDGSLVTRIPANFNRTHQEKHQTRGRVVADARDTGREYLIRYHWVRDGRSPEGAASTTLTVQPVAAGGEPQVWRSAGEKGEAQGAGK